MAKKKNNIIPGHDAFFKSSFSRVDVIIDFILNFLPKELSTKIDVDTLNLDNTEYITPKLKEFFSDLVWNCKLSDDSEIKIALLFEHKSTLVNNPHIQLLRYMLEIWERNIKNKEDLTLVIPIIIYQGDQKWEVKPFNNYFNLKDEYLQNYVPNFVYNLTALRNYDQNELEKMNIGILYSAMMTMRYIKDYNFIKKSFNKLLLSPSNFSIMVVEENYLKQFLVYITNNTEFSANIYENLFNNIEEPIKNKFMTTYENILEKGRKEGIEKGIERGIEKGMEEGIEKTIERNVLSLHNKGISDNEIANLLELKLSKVNELISKKVR